MSLLKDVTLIIYIVFDCTRPSEIRENPENTCKCDVWHPIIRNSRKTIKKMDS